MIKSKTIKFGYFLSIFCFWGGISCFFYGIYNHNVLAHEKLTGKLALCGVLIILISVYGKLLWDSKNICIDINSKSIQLTNRLTRQTKFYSFDYFDNSIIINEPIRVGWARNFYLIKNKKAIIRINGFIYSNQSEIEEALAEIKSLGEMNYTHLNSARILFGFPIIK